MSGEEGKKPKLTNDEFAKQVAEGMIALLKAGTAPWQKPWVPGSRFMPYNALTGRDYRGGNAMWLLARAQTEGMAGARWCTYKQALEMGGQVRRGSKGTRIQYFKFKDGEARKSPGAGGEGDEAAAPARDGSRRVSVYTATVFHESQIDGLPPPAQRPVLPEWERLEKVEALLAASRADIRYIDSNRAFYDLAGDYIQMPLREQFRSGDLWGATVLHELGHWTGHQSRLARLSSAAFGSPEYAREELRAEIASLMLGDELGIGHDPSRHASYVASWIKRLEEDPREVFRASSDAARIVTFIHDLGLERGQRRDPPATRVPLTVSQARSWEEWHDAAITAVVFVETPEDAAGHQSAHPKPGARYVVVGDAGALPDVTTLPPAERRRSPVVEVLEAVRLGRSRPGEKALEPVELQVAVAHTKEGHAMAKRIRGAMDELGVSGPVVMPFNIGRRWADDVRPRSANKAVAR